MTILKAWRCGLTAVVAITLGLLSVMSGTGPLAQGQPPCTVTVSPGESIQQAIDQAAEGAVVCLAAGTWEENIKIGKGLTLRGAGREHTKIKAIGYRKSVLHIVSDAEIAVGIEGLTAAEAEADADGIVIEGKAKVTISTSQISNNGRLGIGMWGSAQATITNTRILNNASNGIYVWDLAQLTIQDSIISGNSFADVTPLAGIYVSSSAKATITATAIFDNKDYGVYLSTHGGDFPQIEGRGNEIQNNGALDLYPIDFPWPMGFISLPPQRQETEVCPSGCAFTSISEGIRATLPGGIVRVRAGTYTAEGFFIIAKSVRLVGEGSQKVVLRGAPMIIRRGEPIEVTIEGLAVTESPRNGIVIYSETKVTTTDIQVSGNRQGVGVHGLVTIQNSMISNNLEDGVTLWWSEASATITNSKISDNEYTGITLWGSQATISDTQISGNGSSGISVHEEAQVIITNVQILANKGGGIEAPGSSSVTIENSEVTENGYTGMRIGLAKIHNSNITRNLLSGIVIFGSAEIQNSTISGNGGDGILMVGSAYATISDNPISYNQGYGVALSFEACGFHRDAFTGKVEGGNNMIYNNAKGPLCPPDYPWPSGFVK